MAKKAEAAAAALAADACREAEAAAAAAAAEDGAPTRAAGEQAAEHGAKLFEAAGRLPLMRAAGESWLPAVDPFGSPSAAAVSRHVFGRAGPWPLRMQRRRRRRRRCSGSTRCRQGAVPQPPDLPPPFFTASPRCCLAAKSDLGFPGDAGRGGAGGVGRGGKTLPVPRVITDSAVQTLHLPCVPTAFAAKTVRLCLAIRWSS